MSRDRDLTQDELGGIQSSFGSMVAEAKQNPKQHLSEQPCTEQQANTQGIPETAGKSGLCSSVQSDAGTCKIEKVTPTGLEDHAFFRGKTPCEPGDAAESGAFPPELAQIIDAWPTLDVATQRQMVAIVEGTRMSS